MSGQKADSVRAEFDVSEHSTLAGWAAYYDKPMCRWRLRCWFGRHILPARGGENGYGPSSYDRCSRCRAVLKWFVVGQHRRGGVDARNEGSGAA